MLYVVLAIFASRCFPVIDLYTHVSTSLCSSIICCFVSSSFIYRRNSVYLPSASCTFYIPTQH